MSKTSLFDGFSEVSSKAWKQKIQVDLKGADYNDTLVWESPEGIKVKPFYHADDTAHEIFHSSLTTDSWSIGQSIYVQNATMANEKAIVALHRGVESLHFTIPSEDVKIETLLKNIGLGITPIYFDLQFLSSTYVKTILDFVGEAIANIFLNIDIIGHLGRSGNWYFNLKQDYDVLGDILKMKTTNVCSVDVSLYENAGANMAQQLAYAMAHANEYLNHLHQNSNDLNTLEGFTFKVSVGTNYFFEIAKLRALRVLWSTLATEYGLSFDCHILATPTKRNKTLYDYNINMLRTTTESMVAVLGGANTVCNLPYDAIYHKDNEFGERIALNQLLLLKNESHFDKVGNASDGSYYIESLTQQLAEKALLLFKMIEKDGGFLSQLKQHTIQRKIRESAQKQQESFEAGTEVLVGTNKYQNENDKMKEDLELYPFVKHSPRKTLIEPIIEKRLAETLEQNRLKDE